MISDERIKELWSGENNTRPILGVNKVLAFARAIEAECRVPKGWVLVPVEPTPEMHAAGMAAIESAPDVGGVCLPNTAEAYECYVAMLAAAPQPEKAEPDVPFPGMQEAFEAHYSQSFTDRDWRREAGVWAAAWKAATRYAECQKVPEGWVLVPLPRFWNKQQSRAWHRAIPNLHAAFDALAEAAEPDFCDTHCTWLDHHPDCERAEPTIAAILPNGATASNVYEAYEEGRKSVQPVAQEPVAFMNAQGKPVSAKWLKHHALEREQDEYTIPLYAAPPAPETGHERANGNAVLVPCDKLAQMKDRIAELERQQTVLVDALERCRDTQVIHTTCYRIANAALATIDKALSIKRES